MCNYLTININFTPHGGTKPPMRRVTGKKMPATGQEQDSLRPIIKC